MPLDCIWARLLPTGSLETPRRYKFVFSQPLMTHCCGQLPHRATMRVQALSSHSWMCFGPCHSISSFPAKQPPTRQSPPPHPDCFPRSTVSISLPYAPPHPNGPASAPSDCPWGPTFFHSFLISVCEKKRNFFCHLSLEQPPKGVEGHAAKCEKKQGLSLPRGPKWLF